MLKRLLIAFTFGCFLSPNLSIAQDQEVLHRVIKTRHTKASLMIDGKIDEPAWQSVEWQSDFTAHSPNNGEQPKHQTTFAVLYDESFIYFAFRCWHDDVSKLENRLGRRDNFPGDWIEIHLDSYNDKSTAFSFTTSVSGVKGDEFVTGNGNNWDENWNPIWYNATQVDDTGWTAEVKIPLSQLRFGEQQEYVWGLNIMRRDFAEDERSTWQWVPRSATGWVSNFGELQGIKGIKPKKQFEIQPYVVTKLESEPLEEGNPYQDGNEYSLTAGIDGKIGITNDMTLDFSINPDFGQVEADPSALNLNGFQIFFDERRPFFVENANLFSYRLSQLEAGGPFNNDNLFYSRRIGAAPKGDYDIDDDAYDDEPLFTTILGSAKLSGKNKKGLSIGLLESVTAEEKVKISLEGQETEAITEPLTNYFVGSVSQDIKQGESKVGISLTSVTRNLNGTNLEDQLNKEAFSGGVDLFHSWHDRQWQVRGRFFMSYLSGTEASIRETQESFEHYFQRPDASHLTVDTTRTNLTGHGGTLSLGNYGGDDNISFQTGITWRSPNLELNDIGFLNTADQIDYVTWAGYRSPEPFSIFRSFRLNLNNYLRWTYGGEHLYHAWNMNTHANFTNYWRVSMGGTLELKDISTKALFGGPKLRQNSGIGPWINIRSDSRKKFTTQLFFFRYFTFKKDKGGLSLSELELTLRYQPSSRLNFSINPGWTYQDRAIQYVDDATYLDDTRYITGRVKQETFYTSIRANYSISPNISIQYWGQPFASKGNYTELKYITDPLAEALLDRYELYQSEQISIDEDKENYSVDENQDGIEDYSFENPDFNFLQFRSNLVFRWEYKPGSEFFLVWTQSNTPDGDPEKNIFPSLREDLFGEKANNVFLMKMTYRFY